MALDEKGYSLEEPTLIKTEVKIGLAKPLRVLQISDTHLALVNENDNERKHALAARRQFGLPEETLALVSEYSKREGLTILHTGDLIDFVSDANLKRVKEFLDANDCFVAAGNHEFSQYVGEAFEDEAYRNQSLPLVQKYFNNDIRFSVREIGGVNFVAIDNSYYKIDRTQLDGLKQVVKMGKPVVLLMHTPLYTKGLFDLMRSRSTKYPVYLMSTPHELMDYYSEKEYGQQVSDAVTDEAYEYIMGERAIKCILAGHLHFCYEDGVGGDLPQYITGLNVIREVLFT